MYALFTLFLNEKTRKMRVLEWGVSTPSRDQPQSEGETVFFGINSLCDSIDVNLSSTVFVVYQKIRTEQYAS